MPQHNSNMPNNTLLTSKYGSHTAKPRPIKSTAARLSAVWAGNLAEDGVKSNWVNAKPKKFFVTRLKTIEKKKVQIKKGRTSQSRQIIVSYAETFHNRTLSSNIFWSSSWRCRLLRAAWRANVVWSANFLAELGSHYAHQYHCSCLFATQFTYGRRFS